MSLPWEEIPHTADWALRVRGDSLRSLFENAARGMASLIGGEGLPDAETIRREIALDAPDLEMLLVDWLTELLVLVEDEGVFFTGIAVSEVADVVEPSTVGLRARVTAVPGEGFTKHIKAVTYHNLAIRQTDTGFETTIVFDV
jgi:SHS2 domain-containing protein